MKVLIALTYYRPHYSGLTIYAERLAKALVKRGHHVTVLTSQFDKNLPLNEIADGVKVIRLPVLLRISKGVIMPSIPLRAWQEIRKVDVVNLHVPQLDAAPIAILARLLNRPVVVTYQCDLLLPEGFINRAANIASNLANKISVLAASGVASITKDYAQFSPTLSKVMEKVHLASAPVELAEVSQKDMAELREKYVVQSNQKVIGMVARLASEKGAEYLVKALPKVLEKFPDARVLYAGQYQDVMGEAAYFEMLKPLISILGERWEFMGLISDEELAAFYQICDVVVVPSTNQTEAFGIVQVEAMTSGTPVIVSDMPGLRQPVLTTGMGKIFPVRDSDALAHALIAVLESPEDYKGDIPAITTRFSSDTVAAEYEEIFEKFIN
ncbi:MAG: glycosyltransferase family 4 protein [Chloroflexota bacterium]